MIISVQTCINMHFVVSRKTITVLYAIVFFTQIYKGVSSFEKTVLILIYAK